MYGKKYKEFACKKQMFLDKRHLNVVYCERFLTAIRPEKSLSQYFFRLIAEDGMDFSVPALRVLEIN